MITTRAMLILTGVVLFHAGCATAPNGRSAAAGSPNEHDPLEPGNRRIFAFNQVVDRVLIKPLAKGYRRVVPEPGRNALRHFLDNLNEPIVLVNDLLQTRFRAAATTGGRFVVNSTVGVAGLFDVASRHHWQKQNGDFGQTLWHWGVREGPYLVLPVLGPSNPRDGVGLAFDTLADPFRYVARNNNYPTALTVSRMGADGIDQRSRNLDALDEMEREAVDYYASFRSLFRQNRAAELRGASAPPVLPPADFYEDPGR